MKEILEKLSSYNIFNNLLPGILFVVLAKASTSYDFIQTDVFLGSFLLEMSFKTFKISSEALLI